MSTKNHENIYNKLANFEILKILAWFKLWLHFGPSIYGASLCFIIAITFYGALAGQRANKGVFITTSGYTTRAINFARSVERIVLVDGLRLAEFMIDNEVGVSVRIVKVPKIDSDYFDEEST